VTRWDAFLPIRTGISKSWSTDLRCLAAGGFAWLVVDAQAYPSQDIAYRELGGISEVLGAPRDQDDRWAVFDLQALGIAPSDSRFFEPFQPLVGMDNGGQGPPVEARGPEPSMAIHSGREASTCPLSISGMRKSF
jgi:hypothetical protein